MQKFEQYKFISDETLALAAAKEFRLIHPQIRSLDLLKGEDSPIDPTIAHACLLWRIKNKQFGVVPSLPETTITVEKDQHIYTVTVAPRDTMTYDDPFFVPKVVQDDSTDECPILPSEVEKEGEPAVPYLIESVTIPSIIPEHNWMAKSICVDAMEIDPYQPCFENPLSKEKLVEYAEVTISVEQPLDFSLSCEFSSYEKSMTIRDRERFDYAQSIHPKYYISQSKYLQDVKVRVYPRQARQDFLFRGKVHKKIAKYNPRMYTYLTMYLESYSLLPKLNVKIQRSFRLASENWARIYRGPEIRKGQYFKYRPDLFYYYYNRYELKDRNADGMTPERKQFIGNDLEVSKINHKWREYRALDGTFQYRKEQLYRLFFLDNFVLDYDTSQSPFDDAPIKPISSLVPYDYCMERPRWKCQRDVVEYDPRDRLVMPVRDRRTRMTLRQRVAAMDLTTEEQNENIPLSADCLEYLNLLGIVKFPTK